ncbi:MAG: putative membrane protein YeaQ/YmgE (transglycosylase-associated protein family), partial [Planctomycetota bacterium]
DMDLVYFLLIGAIAGWLAGRFMKGGGFGAIGNIIVGILGGIIGGFVFGLLGISEDGSMIGSLVTSFVGAVILLYGIGVLKKS